MEASPLRGKDKLCSRRGLPLASVEVMNGAFPMSRVAEGVVPQRDPPIRRRGNSCVSLHGDLAVAALDALCEAIVVCDSAGHVLLANRAAKSFGPDDGRCPG